ncbi:hypothetical protein ACFFRR_006686 [Megaselia abdita]
MWKILLCGFLCVSVVLCSQSVELINTDEPLLTTTVAVDDKPEVSDQTVKVPEEKPSEKPCEKTTKKPVEKPIEPPLPVTYDQRQEGQYNFRADLDNFMIVLVPQNPLEGLNLDILDLLTKSTSKGNSFPGSKPINKKHLPSKSSLQREPNQQHFNFINRQPLISLLSGNQRKVADFLERRTPYKVDLSSENNYNQIHGNHEVPSPYHPMQSIF